VAVVEGKHRGQGYSLLTCYQQEHKWTAARFTASEHGSYSVMSPRMLSFGQVVERRRRWISRTLLKED
jgi:hypothetical protein